MSSAEARIGSTAVKLTLSAPTQYSHNQNAYTGFSGTQTAVVDGNTAQTHGSCYGVYTSGGGSDCTQQVFNLGAQYYIRNVVVYMTTPDMYSGALFTATAMNIKLSTSAVGIMTACRKHEAVRGAPLTGRISSALCCRLLTLLFNGGVVHLRPAVHKLMLGVGNRGHDHDKPDVAHRVPRNDVPDGRAVHCLLRRQKRVWISRVMCDLPCFALRSVLSRARCLSLSCVPQGVHHMRDSSVH